LNTNPENHFGDITQWRVGNARFPQRELEDARAKMALALNTNNLERFDWRFCEFDDLWHCIYL
jgi:hypothetical protein